MVADIDHKYYESKSFIYLEDAFLESEDIVKLLGIYIDKKTEFWTPYKLYFEKS